MKKILFYFFFSVLLISCNIDQSNQSEERDDIKSIPVSVPLNTDGGYILNTVTGNSIPALLDSNGDTIITGRAIPAKAKNFDLKDLGKPSKIKTIETIVSAKSNVHKETKKWTTTKIDQRLIDTIEFGQGDQSYVLKNADGDIVPTGIPIPIKGTTVPYLRSKSILAKPSYVKNNFQVIDVEQGLNSSNVRSSCQDKYGNMWFATSNGACKYDGLRFTYFTTKEGLPSNDVLDLLEDKHGDIWFATSAGLCKFNGKNFTHYTKKEGLFDADIKKIIEDKDGKIWFSTSGHEGCSLHKLDGNSITYYTTKEGLKSNIVYNISMDRSGNLLMSCLDGLSKFDGEVFSHFNKIDGLAGEGILDVCEDDSGNIWVFNQKKIIKFTSDSINTYSSNVAFPIRSIIQDRYGNIWFGGIGGVVMYNGESFTHLTKKEGLSDNEIKSVFEDRIGNIWFGTANGGICKYNNGRFRHFTGNQGLYFQGVYAISEDKSGNIWFGSDYGGVNKIDGNNYIFYRGENEGISSRAFLKDSNGALWIGGSQGLVKYDGKNFTRVGSVNSLLSILEDDHQNIWFGKELVNEGQQGLFKYDGKTLSRFSKDDGLTNHRIRAIAKDNIGNMWFATWGGGVTKYVSSKNGQLGSFTHYTEKEGLIHNTLCDVMQDKEGNMWFATMDGVSKFDGTHFTQYTEKEGLSSNITSSLLEDAKGNIWIGTGKGLDCILFKPSDAKKEERKAKNDREISIINFSNENGLQGMDFYTNSSYLDSKNRAWWGTGKNMTMLDLNTFNLPVKVPAIQLNSIEINDEYLDYNNLGDHALSEMEFDSISRYNNYPLNLTIPYNRNHLTFYFSAIDWVAPQKIKYSYMIENLNEKWTVPSSEPKADYRSLPYGKHTFKVRAKGESNKWSEPLVYTFSINPPWWHSWWARALYVLMALSLIFSYNWWRTSSLKKQKATLEETVKERTIELEQEKTVAEKQRQRAEQSEKYKEQFLANMSHEIRTPMHAISGMVKILKRNEHLPTQDVFLNAMHTSSDNLVVILNDVLDLSKIEAGKLDIENIPMSPTAVIENVTQILKYKAEEKGLQLSFQIDKEVPDLIMGDPTRLNQILINLAGNAIKFTEKGNVNILLQKENDRLKFSVMDTGIGISKEKVETIFGAFEQAKDSISRHYGGTGLGLSISKQLVELQQGKIWVESEEDKGSTFFFELPLVVAAADAVSENLITEDKLKTMAASLEGIRILLAEDNAFNQMIAQDDLSFFIKDVEIDVVENGVLAVEKFKTGNYDLILMDVQMPEMNGFEATRKIRAIEKSAGREKGIPIIAMTASLLKSEIDSCRKAGMNNYIPKPYQPEELIAPIFSELNKS